MRLESIDTHLVVALHALLQERNVTRAAKRVGLTQPSMSHALSKLRDHFDDPLLAPAGRALELTERGRSLLAPVSTAIDALRDVFAPAPPFDPKLVARTFRIASSDNLELLVLPPLAALLEREAPRIDVRSSDLGADWRERLRRGELDVKLGRAETPAPGLRSRVLFQERLVCLVRRGHPAMRGRLTPQRYAALDHLLVAPRGGETGIVDDVLAARGLERRVAMTVPHFLVAPFVVASSDVVLTISTRVAERFASRLGLVTLPCPVPTPKYALAQTWAASMDDDEGHAWFRDAVARVCLEAPSSSTRSP